MGDLNKAERGTQPWNAAENYKAENVDIEMKTTGSNIEFIKTYSAEQTITREKGHMRCEAMTR